MEIPNFKNYPKHLRKAAEVAAIDYHFGPDDTTKLLNDLVKSYNNKFGRAVAAMQLIYKVFPRTMERKGYRADNENLPFDPEKFTLKEKIGEGGENIVILLESKSNNPSYVLKINRMAGGETEEILEKSKETKEQYDKISNWYGEIEDFIPKEQTIVMESLIPGKKCFATLQQYVGGEIKGFFEDYDEQEMVDKLHHDAELKADFQKFLEITFRKLEEEDEVVDLIGENNLAIVNTGGKEKLIFIDPHYIYSSRGVKGKIGTALKRKLDYLKKIGNKI